MTQTIHNHVRAHLDPSGRVWTGRTWAKSEPTWP